MFGGEDDVDVDVDVDDDDEEEAAEGEVARVALARYIPHFPSLRQSMLFPM